MNLLLKVCMLKKYILLHFIFDWHILNFYENTKFDFQLVLTSVNDENESHTFNIKLIMNIDVCSELIKK